MSPTCWWKFFLAMAFALAALPSPLAAKGDANSAKGLVADQCAKCHEVPGYSAHGLETVNAPPFLKIANDPATYTQTRLRAYLLKPHWPMQRFRLSPRDIENLIAYIESLRETR